MASSAQECREGITSVQVQAAAAGAAGLGLGEGVALGAVAGAAETGGLAAPQGHLLHVCRQKPAIQGSPHLPQSFCGKAMRGGKGTEGM